MRRYGELLGWAFQIVDDVLDETSSPEALGKGAQKDRERGKMTYPAAIGLDACGPRARELQAEAVGAVAGLDRLGHLAALAAFVVERTSYRSGIAGPSAAWPSSIESMTLPT